MRAYIVVDLGFGDAGKGLLTDYLVRRLKASLIVRYNGGAQAGHNVVTTDGRHHTFSQFGSGSFVSGVKTYLSHHVVVHPTALLAEGEVLQRKGVNDIFERILISDRALVITPFHQAANRIREILRGADRHGSCGVGVGEAVEDGQSHSEDRLIAGDLVRPDVLCRKLRRIREREREQIAVLCRDAPSDSQLVLERSIFEREDIIETWIASVARIGNLGLVVSDEVLERWFSETRTVVFEGAQGVLLDAEAGFHPFTTWSRCTAENAFNLISEMAPGSQVAQIGVMRSYVVRHGPGPLPTETDVLTSVVSEHNKNNIWQGAVRYGWFDAVLARYALRLTGRLDSLVVTHLDVLSRLKTWDYCRGYKWHHDLDSIPVTASLSDGVLDNFSLTPSLSLAHRALFTQALSTVSPVFETCGVENEEVIRKIESLVGQPVNIISRGPSAENVTILDSIPS